MCISFIKNRVFILAVPFLLSACSVFSPVKTDQTTIYVINTLPQPIVKRPMQRVTLMVEQPTANQVNNTTQMAYTTQPYQVAYFAKSNWAETPAQMLQSLLVQTLQDTHYFYAVGLSSVVGHYDYVLSTRLLQLEQRFFMHSSEVVIKVRAQIINIANNQVIATKQFTVIKNAPENTPYGGVVATNQAMAKILAQVAAFCLHEVTTK